MRYRSPVRTAIRAAESVLDRVTGRPPTSAFLLPVPEAANIVALGRQKTDVLADLPPHITLLYPLPGTHRIDRRVLAEIAEALGAATPFSLRFEQTGRFPEVLYLEPTSPEPLVNLTRLLAGWFPDHPPYGGTYEEIVPHLSVVAHAPEPPGLEAAVRAHLPFDAASSEIWLVSLSRGGHWTTAERFQLGGR